MSESEHEKNKPGLHKEISSIFKGVPIPQNGDAEQSCEPSTPERTVRAVRKPPLREPEPPTAESQSIPGPKAFQLVESSHEVASSQKPEVDIAESSSEVSSSQKPEADIAESSAEAAPTQKPEANIDDVVEKNTSQKSAQKSAVVVTVTSQNFWQQITDKLFTPKSGVSTTRQKAMVVMMPILFIALIFVLRQVFGTTARPTEAAAENNEPGVAAVTSDTKIDWEIPEAYPTTLRDPIRFAPLATAQTETGTRVLVKLTVKGILYTEDNPSAVIGGRIVHEGEEIQGVTVLKISKDSVEFEMNGRKWTQKVR